MRLVDSNRPDRDAAAAVEFALVLPFLILILVISCDFARIYQAYLIVTNCARNGAIWAADPTTSSYSFYPTLQAAAMGDAVLNPQPTVTSSYGTDANGNPNVSVTVTYSFSMVSSYLGFSSINVSRTAEMRVAPATPN
jgi:Flp pilus assembly protein TadG